MSPSSDALHRFVFDGADVRGELARVDAVYRALLERRDYPPPVRRLLGEALAAAALLLATVKLRGFLTLQVQGNGPVPLVVVHARSDGTLRGMAEMRDDPPPGAGFEGLCGHGHLAITLEPEGSERYQGITALSPDGLGATLEGYFDGSEQLPSRVWLAADDRRAAGMLIQRLPQGQRPGDPDAWTRAGELASTVTKRELLGLEPNEVLWRLFHEEELRVFEPRPLSFRCGCSNERVSSVLRALGREEVDDILAEDGEVEVRCEFCGAVYRYDTIDAERLFLAEASNPPASGSYH